MGHRGANVERPQERPGQRTFLRVVGSSEFVDLQPFLSREGPRGDTGGGELPAASVGLLSDC